jgi:hypothetical protein
MRLVTTLVFATVFTVGCSYWQEPAIPASPWTPTLHAGQNAAAAESVAGSLPTPAPRASIEERLRTLKGLHDAGLITNDEMKRRRSEILNEL